MPSSAGPPGTAAQLDRFHAAIADGMRRVGWKFASPGALGRFGVEGPASGWLDGRQSYGSGAVVTMPAGTRLAIEAELAVRAGRDGAIAAYAPAFEIIRVAGGEETAEEVVAGGLFHYGTVFGEARVSAAWPPARPPEVSVGGALRATAEPARIVQDPGAVARAATSHLASLGEGLEPGDWLITGSMIVPFAVRAGDTVTADFGELGTIGVSFA